MPDWLPTLIPVAAGFAVVLIGILVFKLHAFLALILAAVVTGVLTPAEARYWRAIDDESVQLRPVKSIEDLPVWDNRKMYEIPTGDLEHKDKYLLSPDWGGYLLFRRRDGQAKPFRLGHLAPIAFSDVFEEQVDGSEPMFIAEDPIFTDGKQLYVGWDAGLDIGYLPDNHDVIIKTDAFLNARRSADRSIPERIAAAFGNTVAEIGILIAFAAVIGMCLLDSGAADRIVRSALKLVGERGAPVAFTGSGFLLAIPVFFDTVFFLMIPLGKAMRLRTGRNYLLFILTIYCGATMAHSLVPPTPGPLLVAESLNVEIGVMMLVGTCVGLVTASYGICHAWVMNRWMTIPLRETAEMPLADLERLAARQDHELPPLWLSLLPILLPVWLIAQQTALAMFLENPPAALASFTAGVPEQFVTTVNVLGEKNTALGIGVAIALFLLVWQTRASLTNVRDRVAQAIAAGGSIILITAAGGAFGEIIAQTGVASLIQGLPRLGTIGLLCLAFLVTMTIRTVQGSATVAMITSVGLFAGITLPVHPVWLALAIGCGSKPISWMTDSGFWVICKMSGMTEAETLKTLTPMTIMMGLVGLATVLVGATLFPLR